MPKMSENAWRVMAIIWFKTLNKKWNWRLFLKLLWICLQEKPGCLTFRICFKRCSTKIRLKTHQDVTRITAANWARAMEVIMDMCTHYLQQHDSREPTSENIWSTWIQNTDRHRGTTVEIKFSLGFWVFFLQGEECQWKWFILVCDLIRVSWVRGFFTPTTQLWIPVVSFTSSCNII